MIIAALSVGLRLYAADSLKEKRFVLASVKRRLRNRFNVSLAEVGGHERWRWAELSLVIVGIDRKTVDREINAVSTFLDRDVRFEVVEREVEYLWPGPSTRQPGQRAEEAQCPFEMDTSKRPCAGFWPRRS